MNDNKTPEHHLTDISPYIAALQAAYLPAATPAEATHFFSTPEVIDAIKNIDPAARVDPTQIFTALRDAGFDFCNRPGAHALVFTWMFRERYFFWISILYPEQSAARFAAPSLKNVKTL